VPKFSERSLKKLATCDSRLIRLFNEVVKHMDCTILCGTRGKEEQDDAFRKGFSKVQFPNSRHNSSPSAAVDVAPYPIDWNDRDRFYYFAGIVKGIASQMGYVIRWGGDWDSDNDFKDQNFMDWPHFEIKN